MASTCFSPISISGGSQLKARELFSSKSMSFAKTPMLTVQRKLYGLGSKRNLSVRAEYEFLSFSGMNFSVVVHSLAAFDHMNDNSSGGGGGDFFAGFLLGGAVFGTLAYVFAPQIRRSLLNEDEYGFRKARRPIYDYDEGLEKTRQTLNKKISQLNSAIDNVSSRLRGGKNNAPPTIAIESDPEVEATM